uniref:Uncharacterized protein n=1 Tax=Branchiostoma floridae TaxID=7739 RepID=C3Z174_BRAFL|eukprot:XP_002597761.1 hypothetical protein BRAFLDRAFT_77336 [Branchiostoma floridae]
MPGDLHAAGYSQLNQFRYVTTNVNNVYVALTGLLTFDNQIPLFRNDNEINQVWASQQKHLECIQDPPDRAMYSITKYVTKNEHRLPYYTTVRGSNILEKFHKFLPVMIPEPHCAAIPFQVYPLSGIARWNTNREANSVLGKKGRKNTMYTNPVIHSNVQQQADKWAREMPNVLKDTLLNYSVLHWSTSKVQVPAEAVAKAEECIAAAMSQQDGKPLKIQQGVITQLLGALFTRQQLAESSVHGGNEYKALGNNKVQAIFDEERKTNPSALPVQYIPYASPRDQCVRGWLEIFFDDNAWFGDQNAHDDVICFQNYENNLKILIGAPWRQVAVPAPVIAQVDSFESNPSDKYRASKVRALMDALFTSDKMIHNNTDGSESDGLGSSVTGQQNNTWMFP